MPMFARNIPVVVTEVVPYNVRRKSLVIFNNGVGRVFISVDEANVSTQGFPLDAGATIGFVDLEGDEPYLRYFAQSVAGTNELRIVEGFGIEAGERQE